MPLYKVITKEEGELYISAKNMKEAEGVAKSDGHQVAMIVKVKPCSGG